MHICPVLLLFFLQSSGTPVRYVDLTGPSGELPAVHGIHGSVSGCGTTFDDNTPKPWDYCYPFPARLKIIAYKPDPGGAKASLVLRVTNGGKTPIRLPAGIDEKYTDGRASSLRFSVSLQNVTWTMGFAEAFGHSGDPSSFATIGPGESIDYEIPVDLNTLREKVRLEAGTEVPVVVKLYSWTRERRENGEVFEHNEGNPIPSDVFRIPYPGPR